MVGRRWISIGRATAIALLVVTVVLVVISLFLRNEGDLGTSTGFAVSGVCCAVVSALVNLWDVTRRRRLRDELERQPGSDHKIG